MKATTLRYARACFDADGTELVLPAGTEVLADDTRIVEAHGAFAPLTVLVILTDRGLLRVGTYGRLDVRTVS